MKPLIKKILFSISILLIFFIGFITGKIQNNQELHRILDISQNDVKLFSIKDEIIYQASTKSYIENSQKEGFDLLLDEIGMVGYKRHKTEGTTAHTKYKIEMKNGDIYYIEHLGCMHQVDITYPNGKTIKYYAYY